MAKGVLHLNVEFSAVTDEEGKFGRLATLLGLADAAHALGMCTRLWLACTRRGEAELPQWLVEQVLGARGPDALVESELASWAGGRGDSKTRRLRIGGAEKHCLWMVTDQAAKSEQSSKGGKTRAATASRAGGRFTSDQPAPPPAQTSPSEISSASEISDQNSPSARAIPQVVQEQQHPAGPAAEVAMVAERPAPTGNGQNRPVRSLAVDDRDPKPANVVPPGESAWHRRMRWWGAMLEADARIRAAGIEPNAPTLPKNMAGENERNLAACERQLVDAGFTPVEVDAKMLHVVAVAEAEALRADNRSRKWFKPALIWDPGRANRAVDTSVDEAKRARPAPGQRNAAPPPAPTKRAEPRPPDPVRSAEDIAVMLAQAEAVAAAPDRGREIAALPTAELVKRFGGDSARSPPASAGSDDPTAQPRRRKAAP